MVKTDIKSIDSLHEKENENPLLSIITVNYNGLQDTCELIDSLLNTIFSVSFEIIVVDNASRIDEAEILKNRYPQIITIRSDINLGFSGGNNLGIQNAKGDYYFFMNNDTYVRTDGFRSMIDVFKLKPEIAAVSPKILFAEPGNTIQFAGYTPLTKITLRNEIIGFGQLDDGRWDIPKPIPIVNGAAMLFRKSAIDRIGFMPEIYFLYYEELDWSASIQREGLECWYIPSCVVFHKGSKSTGVYSPMQIFYKTRNRLLYAWRNLTGMNRFLSIAYQIFLANPKACFLFFIKGRVSLSKSCICGINAFLKMEK
ncbi:MAG: glycosyltransferase family 2 protein [Bacteroidales bacterium]|nr:glycosyltransferase family 2 protein [Bacteroidales bacterium]